MTRPGARMPTEAVWALAAVAAFVVFVSGGCGILRSPIRDGAFIRTPIEEPPPLPVLGPPPAVPTTPTPTVAPDGTAKPAPVAPEGPLSLSQVLDSVNRSFPLLLAIQEQRAIAAATVLSAEGAFDLSVRSSFTNQQGSFDNNRYDLLFEQPTPLSGASFFAGYRTGIGDFAVYNLGQKTGAGGEYRMGVQLPLLRDGPIDRRRAALRQAQILEELADPVIRRARLDYLRTASRAYWVWVAAGEQYRIAKVLYDTTDEFQRFLQKRLDEGAEDQVNVERNRQVLLERNGLVVTAERVYQRAAIELSLFLRDANGDPVIPKPDQLPPDFYSADPLPIGLGTADADVVTALESRPELDRFRLEKQGVSVDLQLALNQFYPALNVGASLTQDNGRSSRSFTGTGIFASDLNSVNLFATFDLPLQRRGARGDVLRHQARLRQLLENEKFAQNVIRNEVLDALADMDRAYERLKVARREQAVADDVVAKEVTRLQGRADVLAVNIRQFQAAQARARVAGALADFYRAFADYQAALGKEGETPKTKPAEPPKPEGKEKEEKK
jgi:cobalt-zinc-cadmium efflux system outer membrane protein